MFNIKPERLVQPSIGQGPSGEIFLYQKSPQDSRWVVKCLKVDKIEDLLRCLPEIVLGFSCDHPSIVPIRGYSIEPKDDKHNIYLKLPRMTGGNLADELKRRNQEELYFSENELVEHFYALISAVAYLHSKKISHGDLKIQNILLDEKGDLKLCNIGSGRFTPADVNYKAPEIVHQSEKSILKREHLHLADSWSLGLVMLEMCTLESKLIDPSDSVQVIEESLQKIRKEAEKRYSDVLLEIIFGLLKTDPTQRLRVSTTKTQMEGSFQQILVRQFERNA